MLSNSQMVAFSEGISTILQKGKVVSNPVQIPRLIQTRHSYNLRPRKNPKCVKWPDLPIEGSQGMDFNLPSDF